jgi:hypothetical protein
MTNRRTTKGTAPQAPETFIPPYPPSWFDRFTVWVDRLPGPAWAYYLILAVFLVLEINVVQWVEGAYPFGTFYFAHVFIGVSLPYFLGLMHYLDKAAASAMDSFRPLLSLPKAGARSSARDRSTFADLSYQLTTLPRRPALLATLAGAAFTAVALLGDPTSGSGSGYLAGTAGTPLATASVLVAFIPINVLLVLILYHSVHQLTQVSRIYTKHARINVYQLQSLYALSLPGAYTALGLIVFVYGLWASTRAPEGMAAQGNAIGVGIAIGVSLFFAAIAVAAFAWPLWGAHRRLVKEKEARLADVYVRFEAATHELHRRLDSGRLAHMDDLNKAVATLEIEQNTLRKIATWPWQPGAVRAVVAALLLPVALWAIERLLARVVGA